MSGFEMSKIKTNPVVDKLRKGEPAIGSWLSLCSPASAEMMAQVGWDWLVVDVEHSPVGFDTMVNCFRAIQLGGSIPMLRVPWNDTIWIQRSLDAGALGVVVPMINSVEDAEKAVANTKYAPRGIRSNGGSRVSGYVDGDYSEWAQDNIATIVMIETIQAVEKAEEILSVEGVDGCFIGPNDLAMSMGCAGQTGPGTEHEAAMLAVLEAAKKVGVAAGKHCTSVADLNLRVEQGFQFLAYLSDLRIMVNGANQQFAQLKTGAKAASAGSEGRLY